MRNLALICNVSMITIAKFGNIVHVVEAMPLKDYLSVFAFLLLLFFARGLKSNNPS
jgi:hypothetical protein